MNSSIIITIIGMTILSTATFAFAATLSTPLEFNLIGASDNVLVPTARVNVTAIDFITEVSDEGVIETDGIDFSVGNEDTLNAHTFEICLVLEGPIGIFSPIIGNAPACTTTASIAANAILTSQTITLTSAMNVTDIFDISISVEETS